MKEWTLAQVAQELEQWRKAGFDPRLTIRTKPEGTLVELDVGDDTFAKVAEVDDGLSYVFDSARDLVP